MRVPVALVALAVAAGAGCGGGGSSDTGAAKGTINADSQRRAKSMLLRLSDFPAGWRASAPDPVDKGVQANLRKCVGIDFSTQNVTGKATSRDFGKTGQTTDAYSGATIVGSPAQAQDRFEQEEAIMSGSKVTDCATKLFQGLFQGSADYKVGEVDVGELRITVPENVEKARGWQFAILLVVTSGASKGSPAIAYIDFVELLNNDALAQVSTLDSPTPFDPMLRDQLVRTVAARMT
jgi:hypothetical protein